MVKEQTFFDSPSWDVRYYTEYIDDLKEGFIEWINKIDVNVNRDDYFMPNTDDFVLTFNYTETIEKNYSIEKIIYYIYMEK